MSVSLQTGARVLERWYGWNIKLYRNRKIHSLFSTISSFDAPSSTPGENRHMPLRTFCLKFDAEKLLFEAFFGILSIFGSIQPKSECNFPFLYNLIFPPYHLSRPLASLRWEIDICPCRLFCPKLNAKKLLFEAFFGILRIFGSIQPKSECNFLFLYNLIFQLNTGDNHVLSPVVIKNGVCPHSGCSSALAGRGQASALSHWTPSQAEPISKF